MLRLIRIIAKIIHSTLIFLIVVSAFYSGYYPWFQGSQLRIKQFVVHAANTGALTAGGNAAVTSSAGNNNGYETTPTNTTSSNNAYAVSTNTATAASSSCALPNTGSDQHDFTTFGVSLPAGAKVTGIALSIEAKYDSNTGTNTICSFLTYNGGTNWTAGKNTGDIQNSDSTNALGSSSDLWGRASWTATELNNTNFKVRLMTLVANTARDSSLDFLTVTVYYNEAPGVPSQDSPSNGATSVNPTPTFTMTATDADADKLGYKVTIYSNSGCTTITSDNDQATSTSGWSGTNTTCTANPTSCYTSGTQGTFLAQSALSNSTQYWWRAKAKDPDGSTSVIDSSTCNNFTTASGVFSVTASSSQSFDSALVFSFNSQTSSISNLGAIKIIDDRGTLAGWTLAMSGQDWAEANNGAPGGHHNQLDYDGNGSDGNLGKLCPKPNNGTLYAQTGSLTGVSKGSNQCFSSGVTSITIVTATAGNGNGTYWLTDMPAEQFIPSNPTAQVYTTTITLTVS